MFTSNFLQKNTNVRIFLFFNLFFFLFSDNHHASSTRRFLCGMWRRTYTLTSARLRRRRRNTCKSRNLIMTATPKEKQKLKNKNQKVVQQDFARRTQRANTSLVFFKWTSPPSPSLYVCKVSCWASALFHCRLSKALRLL